MVTPPKTAKKCQKSPKMAPRLWPFFFANNNGCFRTPPPGGRQRPHLALYQTLPPIGHSYQQHGERIRWSRLYGSCLPRFGPAFPFAILFWLTPPAAASAPRQGRTRQGCGTARPHPLGAGQRGSGPHPSTLARLAGTRAPRTGAIVGHVHLTVCSPAQDFQLKK